MKGDSAWSKFLAKWSKIAKKMTKDDAGLVVEENDSGAVVGI